MYEYVDALARDRAKNIIAELKNQLKNKDDKVRSSDNEITMLRNKLKNLGCIKNIWRDLENIFFEWYICL